MIATPKINRINFEIPYLNGIETLSKSMLMWDIYHKILEIAKINTHVMIVGEIGSGKKKLAEIIHKYSPRAEGPFYSFYCPAVKEEEYKEAFEEELHIEENHMVLKYKAIEKARSGFLYLDEFSELPYQHMENIIDSYLSGKNQIYRYDEVNRPRLIISLNQVSYLKMLHTNTWLSILDALNPMVIMIPPLRERKEDIPLLVNFFLDEIRAMYSEWKDLTISKEALDSCLNHDWPGNLRQLKNAIIHGAILSNGRMIKDDHLPFTLNWKLPYDTNLTVGSHK